MNTLNDTPDYIEIPLPQNRIAIVSPQDSDMSNFRWHGLRKGKIINAATKYYAVRNKTIGVKTQYAEYMHRVILARMLGRELVKGEWVDHINGNGLDNRRENLRLSTIAQNAFNKGKHSNNTSGYKGVSWNKFAGRWVAQITIDGKNKYLGYFDTPEEAHAAYCAKAKELHGEFFNPG